MEGRVRCTPPEALDPRQHVDSPVAGELVTRHTSTSRLLQRHSWYLEFSFFFFLGRQRLHHLG